MHPIKFPESTKDLQKPAGMTDEQCGPLPVYSDGKVCLSYWGMAWRERLSLLLHGRIWLWVWMGSSQPPVMLEAKRTVFEKPKQCA